MSTKQFNTLKAGLSLMAIMASLSLVALLEYLH